MEWHRPCPNADVGVSGFMTHHAPSSVEVEDVGFRVEDAKNKQRPAALLLSTAAL